MQSAHYQYSTIRPRTVTVKSGSKEALDSFLYYRRLYAILPEQEGLPPPLPSPFLDRSPGPFPGQRQATEPRLLCQNRAEREKGAGGTGSMTGAPHRPVGCRKGKRGKLFQSFQVVLLKANQDTLMLNFCQVGEEPESRKERPRTDGRTRGGVGKKR